MCFFIFKDGGAPICHLECSNFRNVKGRDAEGPNASLYQILLKSVKRLRIYGGFSIFENGARQPSWIFKFGKF